MFSSAMQRLNERRNAAGDPGEDSGFTLIELMVVLLILAILLAIAIPTFLGVTGGANDRAAQSNLNTALTNVKAAGEQAGQTYTGISNTSMSTLEPSLTWSAGAVTTQGPVSIYASTTGNGVALASFSKNSSTCWWVVDNLAAVATSTTADGVFGTTATNVATGAPTTAPSQQGTWYGKSTGACNGAAATAGATWQQGKFPGS